MELPINTVIILVVLVVLILVSRASYNYLDVGEDKIDTSGSITNCEILCWECCRGITSKCDDPYEDPDTWCGCKQDGTGC